MKVRILVYRHWVAVFEPASLGPGLVEVNGQLEGASGQPLLLLLQQPLEIELGIRSCTTKG